MSVYKVNSSLPTTDKINDLSDMIIEVDGKTSQAKFDINEITQLFTDLSANRKYLRDIPLGHTLSTYSNWAHLYAETGYSIWRYSPTRYAYDAENCVYLDNKAFVNRGQANSESANTFSKVYLFNGATYIDDTTEAGTEGGTSFDLMADTNDYLYLGSSSTFSGIKFEFATRGSNYDVALEFYHTGAGWIKFDANIDSFVDDTSDFESDGSITWSNLVSGTGWGLTTVNSQSKYWTRLKTIETPITTAKANYIIPGDSVIALLALSSSQFENEKWAYCTYSTNIYVTLRNTGASAYEGNYYIASSSSPINLQNYFVYNHEIKADYKDSSYVKFIATNVGSIAFILDGGGSAITAGIKGDLEIPFACQINSWTLLADRVGGIKIDVLKDSDINFPPTYIDSMPGSGSGREPIITASNVYAHDSDISDWNSTSIEADDVLRFQVYSGASVQRCTLNLRITKV